MADELELRRAERQKVKLRIGISGIAGSGKTWSALKLAYGLCGDWKKIAVINSETNQSANLYAENFGEYLVIDLTEAGDYSPDRYIKAIRMCEKAGIEVVIIDSISHEWTYILDNVKKQGHGIYGWDSAGTKHQEFVTAMTTSKCHTIMTCRRVKEYVKTQNEKGKESMKAVGTKEQTREHWDYDLVVHFVVDNETHEVVCDVDRTQLFAAKDKERTSFLIDFKTGEDLRVWCNTGVDLEQEKKDAIYNVGKSENGVELGILYDGVSPSLHRNEEFLDALRKRAIAVVDFAKSGKELADGYRHLPEFARDNADLKNVIINKAVELVPLHETIHDLRSYWEEISGKGDALSVLPFVKADKRVYDTVRAWEHELIGWGSMANADEMISAYKGLFTKMSIECLPNIKKRAMELLHETKSADSLRAFYLALCGSSDGTTPATIPLLRADSVFIEAVKKHQETVKNLVVENIPPAPNFEETPSIDNPDDVPEVKKRPDKVRFPKKKK